MNHDKVQDIILGLDLLNRDLKIFSYFIIESEITPLILKLLKS